MRYIGSKEQLLSFIEESVNSLVSQDKYVSVGDLFSGSAAVSRLFKQRGKRITANDNLRFCYTLAKAALDINEEPQFEQLIRSGEIRDNGSNLFSSRYDLVLAYLATLDGEPGFIFREYSPGGSSNSEYVRRYFSDENAQKIDAIRNRIARWTKAKLLSEAEASLLISDLIRATNRVANIAGTYGCFLKRWDARAHRPLLLRRSRIVPSDQHHEVYCTDAHQLAMERNFDLLYLDPPYTWRHYGAYYHILETIAMWDEPIVTGRTGLRPWEHSKSRYCDRSDAPVALRELINAANCKHLFLSYNSDGMISHEQVMEALSLRGIPVCNEIEYRRYRSNNGGTKTKSLKERLYYVETS